MTEEGENSSENSSYTWDLELMKLSSVTKPDNCIFSATAYDSWALLVPYCSYNL